MQVWLATRAACSVFRRRRRPVADSWLRYFHELVQFITAPTALEALVTNNNASTFGANSAILPFVTLGSSTTTAVSFANVTGSNNVVPLPTGDYFGSIGAATAGNVTNGVVMETASDTGLSGSVSIGALLLNGNNISVGGSSFMLSFAAGGGVNTVGAAVVNNGAGNDLGMATMNFGMLEGILDNVSGSLNTTDGTNNTVLAGSGGLTIAGSGFTTLATANVYSGATNLDSGTVTLNTNLAIPVISASITVTTGALLAAVPVTLANANFTFNTNDSQYAFAGSNQISILGIVGLGGAAVTNGTKLSVTDTGGTVFAGQVTGAGFLSVSGNANGSSPLYLTNAFGAASSASIQLDILSGIVNVQQASALGAASITVASSGAALQLQSAVGFTMSRPLVLYGAGVNNNGALENVLRQ